MLAEILRNHTAPIAVWIVLAIVRGSLSIVLAVLGACAEYTLPSITLNAFRSVLSTIALTIILACYAVISQPFRKSISGLLTRSGIGKLIFMAFFQNALPFTLFTEAGIHLAPTIGGLFFASVPFFTLMMSKLFLPEETMFHRANVVAIILGLGGVTVGSMSHIFTPTQSNDGASRALVIASFFFYFIGAVSWGLAAVFWRKYCNDMHFLAAAWGQSFFTMFMAWPIALIVDYNYGPDPYPIHFSYFAQSFVQWQTWLALLWAGLLSGVGSAIMNFYLMKTIGPVKATATLCLVPPISSIEGNAILQEWVGAPAGYIVLNVIGQAMLITALAVQLRREAQKLEARREAVQRERARTLLEPSTAKSLVIPLRMSELTTFDGDTANGDADMYIAFDEETDSGDRKSVV